MNNQNNSQKGCTFSDLDLEHKKALMFIINSRDILLKVLASKEGKNVSIVRSGIFHLL